MSLQAISKVVASSFAGLTEVYIFHPFDTIVKRLQSNRDRTKTYSQIVFGSAAAAASSSSSGILSKYASLVPGLGFAVAYKVVQRGYKFGVQPLMKGVVRNTIPRGVSNRLSPNWNRVLVDSLAGSLIGVGEVALLPLDTIKVKLQAADKKASTLAMIKKEGISGLYSGIGWTLARNIPGSLSLFGASAIAKEIMGPKVSRTFVGHAMSSLVGSVVSIVVSSPCDTIKTRSQLAGGSDIKGLLRDEGVKGLFKGMGTKLSITAPKLIFAFTVSEWLSEQITKLFPTTTSKQHQNEETKK